MYDEIYVFKYKMEYFNDKDIKKYTACKKRKNLLPTDAKQR